MSKRQIKYYRYPHPNNVGDTLTPYILEHFVKDTEFIQVKEQVAGKLIVVGSIMRVINSGDTILGAGVMRETDQFPQSKECKFLAVRGKLSQKILESYGAKVPNVYGDPALLLPLMYKPKGIKKTHKVGIIPHFVDKRVITQEVGDKLAKGESWKMIDIFLQWEEFVNEILTCERVISSSLHGIVIAEAYGLPAEWVVLSDRVIGNGFKFKDYLTGTGRKAQEPGQFPLLDKKVLADVQKKLLSALRKL